MILRDVGTLETYTLRLNASFPLKIYCMANWTWAIHMKGCYWCAVLPERKLGNQTKYLSGINKWKWKKRPKTCFNMTFFIYLNSTFLYRTTGKLSKVYFTKLCHVHQNIPPFSTSWPLPWMPHLLTLIYFFQAITLYMDMYKMSTYEVHMKYIWQNVKNFKF